MVVEWGGLLCFEGGFQWGAKDGGKEGGLLHFPAVNGSGNQIRRAVILMKFYNFELNGHSMRELIVKWTRRYPHSWIALAVAEAIYQGRLKAVSVEQILNSWMRRGGVAQSFNCEFLRLIEPEVEEEEGMEDYNSVPLLGMGGNSVPVHEATNHAPVEEDLSHFFRKLRGFVMG